MKRLTCMLVCVVSVALMLALPASAQQEYLVQPGDNLWKLAGEKMGNPATWEQIYTANPFLQEDGRRFEKYGVVYVLIRPGEKLAGLERLGITPELVPLEKLRLSQAPAPPPTTTDNNGWRWVLTAILLAIGIFVIVVIVTIRKILNADPVYSRPAVVPGGVTAETAAARFQVMASQSYQAQFGRLLPSQMFTILATTPGRIWGILNVLYGDGKEVLRRLNGEQAFRAWVRLPNGAVEILYMLQGCGNDLRFGGISRYLPGPDFRFEVDPVVPPVQPPQPQPVQPQPVVEPQPAPTPAPAGTAAPQRRIMSFSPAQEGQPNLLRISGFSEVRFEEIGGMINIRFR